MKDKNLPNFLIVGAPKAGTSAIAKYLDSHPEVFIPKIKEPRYFLHDILDEVNKSDPIYEYLINSSILNWEKYLELYEDTDSTVVKFGDASVQYLYHYETVIPKIKNKLGNVPIIIILRDPTERAYSNFKFQNRKQFLSFEEGLNKEEQRIKDNYNSFWYYKDIGLYCKQVHAYKNAFTNVHICYHDDLVENMEKEMKAIYSFLKIDSDFSLDYSKKYNETQTPKGRILKYIYYIINSNEIKLNFLPEIIKKNIKEKFFTKEENKMKIETSKYLRNFFKNDIKCLEKLLNKDLSKWYEI